MFVVVVFLPLVPFTVVLSMFLLIILLVLSVGPLELLYYSSYYAQRGGSSTVDAVCGAFYVNAHRNISTAGWSGGAALNYFILCSAWW